MTLSVTIPDALYQQLAEIAVRARVSVERIAAAAPDKAPAVDPAPEDRI